MVITNIEMTTLYRVRVVLHIRVSHIYSQTCIKRSPLGQR